MATPHYHSAGIVAEHAVSLKLLNRAQKITIATVVVTGRRGEPRLSGHDGAQWGVEGGSD